MIDVGVIGAGAWGTALAISLAASGKPVGLWGRDVGELAAARENTRYLPGVAFPGSLALVRHFEALSGCRTLLLVTPAQSIRPIAAELARHIEPECRIVLCAKGVERGSGLVLSEVVTGELPGNPIAVLSGPSFAAEVAAGLPTAATLACTNEVLAAELAASLSSRSLRLYHSTDVIGVELAGALKNVIAIACGIVIGRGLGENARAALMTRGLAEIARLGMRLGARMDTFMGLSGLGDLALTCASRQSRNFSFGWLLGSGATLEEAAAGTLVEGMATAEAVLTLARAHGMAMPIADAVQAILAGMTGIEETIIALMARPLKPETA